MKYEVVRKVEDENIGIGLDSGM